MEYAYGISDDYLDEDDDGVMYSTKNFSSESEDECKFVLSNPKSTNKEESLNILENDEFEKEMAAELEATVKKLTSPFYVTPSSAGTSASNDPTYYDKIYFDSDESDSESDNTESNPNKRKAKHKFLSNDELFYDPLMDEADQAFVDRQRKSYQLKVKKRRNLNGENKPDPLPRSDAVLSCPACFTTLCLDCQRHEVYKNQYRAMFVFNCLVDRSEVLHFSVKEKKKKLKGKRKNQKAAPESQRSPKEMKEERESKENPQSERLEEGTDDVFNPVKCTICNTKVAVQDNNEVYHFFNILTSY